MSKRRSYKELKKNAVIFWPVELADKEQAASIIPILIDSQDKFISLLHVADSSPGCWKDILVNTSKFPANLFLKHLMVLADVGGEQLKRFRTELSSVFTNGTMDYRWSSQQHRYTFQSLDDSRWDNKSLGIDGKGLSAAVPLCPAMEDIAMLLLFGGSATNAGVPPVIGERCTIGQLLGKKEELDTFVRQRYIWVSRITGGATANAMGYLAQNYVKERLQGLLPQWDFSKKTIPGISQNAGRTDISFDLLAESPRRKYCAIEVSFQVTTNSTIERKAGQAQARQRLLHKRGHHIAYVIDGAGNFERRSALSTICQYSDCTVTFRDVEINRLAAFLKSVE
jgi:hypothetical protein